MASERIEHWLPIPGYPGYEVSDRGNVRSLTRVIVRSGPKGPQRRRGVVLKPVVGRARGGEGTPYRAVTLYGPEGKRPNRKIANLMLLAHVGPKPFPKAVARHLDDDSLNDTLGNLAWGTYDDNAADAIRNGRAFHPVGEKHPLAKLTDADVVAIRQAAATGATERELGQRYGVHRGTIWQIVHRKTWRHI